MIALYIFLALALPIYATLAKWACNNYRDARRAETRSNRPSRSGKTLAHRSAVPESREARRSSSQ